MNIVLNIYRLCVLTSNIYAKKQQHKKILLIDITPNVYVFEVLGLDLRLMLRIDY